MRNRRAFYPGPGTDKARFSCVWKGEWYELASLSEHLKAKVPEDKFLLLDKHRRDRLVPKSEVHINRAS